MLKEVCAREVPLGERRVWRVRAREGCPGQRRVREVEEECEVFVHGRYDCGARAQRAGGVSHKGRVMKGALRAFMRTARAGSARGGAIAGRNFGCSCDPSQPSLRPRPP